jgi:uncharacterized protein YjbI with pentapeptide repeats
MSRAKTSRSNRYRFMLLSLGLPRSLVRYSCGRMFFAALAICLGIGGPALAQVPYHDRETAEGWAWARIKESREANFNERCGTPALDPRAEDETGWTNSCRRISATFLIDILTQTPLRNEVPFVGVTISGARIEGDIDFQLAKLDRSLLIAQSRIENDINFDGARTDSLIGFAESRIAGRFSAKEFRSELSLVLVASKFRQNASLNSAKIDGRVDMSGATFDEDLDATSIQVGAHLSMRSASFKGVRLAGAKVTGEVDINGTFDGHLDADLLQVGESLLMKSTAESKTSFKTVSLGGTKVTGLVVINGTFGRLHADFLQVGESLKMESTAESETSFKEVHLGGARIGGQVVIKGATFDGSLYADSLHVGASLIIRPAELNKTSFKETSFKGEVNLESAKVSGNVIIEGAIATQGMNMVGAEVSGNMLIDGAIATQPIHMGYADIRGSLHIGDATLAGLDLSGSSVGRSLVLGWSQGLNKPTRWVTAEGKPGELVLRNTRVANLMDAEDAWPTKGHLHLDGFTFATLGGFLSEIGHEMRTRRIVWWDDWARRDPAYSLTPYEQLAAALVAAGDRPAADEVRFLGRVRQRETEKNWWLWIFSGFLQYAAGFGIGTYTFRVLYWVIGISVLGGLYLWQCVPAAYHHGPIWCFGASLSRLLPVIEINKEFTDFFNDPRRARLTSWQSFVFSVIGIVGWVLGAILIAAISGLTQKP